MDSVRTDFATLPTSSQDLYAAEIQAFVGQEATHRHIHALFNAHLLQAGLYNWIEVQIQKRYAAIASQPPYYPRGEYRSFRAFDRGAE